VDRHRAAHHAGHPQHMEPEVALAAAGVNYNELAGRGALTHP
jgi:hypothetical protein